MTTITVRRSIAAPATRVFEVASDIERFPEANPDVLGVEFVTERREGVGTRFRETRRQGSKEMVTELEVTEFDPAARRIRMVTDMGGTIWDTVFEVRESGSGAEVVATMDCRAHALLSKVLNPILKPLFKRGMERHFDSFQAHCEGAAAGTEGSRPAP